MYTSTPTLTIRRRLNKHATTIFLGGIFMCFSLSFYISMCDTPCENTAEYQHVLNAKKIHEGHNPVTRNYDHVKAAIATEAKNITHLVVLILTTPNSKSRVTIRETWLSVQYPNVSHIFAVGTSGLNSTMAAELMREQAMYQDLLFLSNVAESYHSLTDKVLSSFIHLGKTLDFKYVLKVDDDTFVQLDKMLLELKSKPNEKLYWGFFDGRANVKKTGQWAESKWILCDKYGPHARGGGYVLSSDLVNYISRNSALLQKFNSEDISVGTWLGPLNIHREHDPRFDTEYKSRGCNNQYIVTHKQSLEDMREKWKNIQLNGFLCTEEFSVKAILYL